MLKLPSAETQEPPRPLLPSLKPALLLLPPPPPPPESLADDDDEGPGSTGMGPRTVMLPARGFLLAVGDGASNKEAKFFSLPLS